jgi:myo-inositol-1(or 4)-monophosphatase
MSTLSANITVMMRAAEKAARSLVHDFNEVEQLQVTAKGPGDFVSRADKRSEEILLENLQKDRPEWGFMGEEGTKITGSDPRYRWIIDPLDGTNNFLHAVPHWCINIALEKDNEIIAALTVDPIRNETFRAEKGGGAFLDRTRLRVSGRKTADVAQISLDIGNRMADAAALATYTGVWQKMAAQHTHLRFFGAAALDLAYVAAGRLDAYANWGASPWDIAAGILLVREAAGMATDFSLRPVSLDKGEIVAGCVPLHKTLAAQINA